MKITDEIWEVIKDNDKKLDNKLWYGVATTKIFVGLLVYPDYLKEKM
ncbi:hypothetical protein LLT6_08790 [Lactococcus cremoris subsp. cremoris TIFN6]|uniref:Uncharacterized protein n=1 Tax=Lactococcus cremoris subsp. cremoris TIFN6 TaxID=1234876 RepID=T0TGW8_LACLC|nr:hypothetical protein LLT6_08790 [Lactococcus cremoris subsp. cremoris TIFN6]